MTHEHHFDSHKKKNPNSSYNNSFKYSVLFSILNPHTFEIIMMSKNSIFFLFYFASTTLIYKLYFLYIYSAQLWAKSFFAPILNHLLNVLLLIATTIAIKRIFYAKIVSDFYLTVYSERLMDLCFAIQAIHRLLAHVENTAQTQMIGHEYCLASCNKVSKRRLKAKSFNFFHSCTNTTTEDEELYEESIEPIIASYHQFRQLLLNSAQFEGIIDSKCIAKKTARLIYEHFYIPLSQSYSHSVNLTTHKRKSLAVKAPFIPYTAELNRSHFKNIFNSADEEKLFHILQLSDNSTISPLEFKLSLVKLYFEKEALSKSLLDHGRAVKKLEQLFSLFSLTIIIILIPLVIGLPVKELFAVIGGLCSLSFMFGQSSAVIFNSIIFMFITHPFDVGDRVFMFSDTYFVHEIGTYYTVFQTIEGLLVYVPNSLLIDQHIVNINRSKNMTEWIDIVVDYDTSTAKLSKLASKIRTIIENENKDFELDGYQKELAGYGFENSNPSLIKCVEMVNSRSFRLGIALCHKYNFQNGFERAERHIKFMKALHKAMKELSIVYYPPRLRLRFNPEEFC